MFLRKSFLPVYHKHTSCEPPPSPAAKKPKGKQ
nr:MAG TPA: hypothetical protein [Caudoviricetes sp.]DAV77503.1 MAG TPA: hypothetical protein [Caudoviricetes sp.]